MERVVFCILASLFIIASVLAGVQTCRLHAAMGQCEQYREELESAHDRQSEIAGIVAGAGEILGATANSLGELRKKLEEVEDSYYNLWKLVSDDYYNNGSGEDK